MQVQETWFNLPTDNIPLFLFALVLFGIVAALIYYVENRLVAPTTLSFSWRWRLLTVVFFLALGWFYAHHRAAIRINHLLDPKLNGKTVELNIAVDQLPQTRQYGFRYDVMVIDPPKGIPNRLRINEYRVDAPLQAGSRWSISVRLYTLHSQYNPHAFDYEGWLFLHGLGATGTIQKRLTELEPSFFSWAAWRSALLKRINQSSQETPESQKAPESVAVLGLGVQTHLNHEIWNLLRQSGTIHLFSISGLHVTMLAMLIGSIVGTLWKYSTRLMRWLPALAANQWAMLLTAWSYALISGMGFATQRTVIMLTLVFLIFRWGLYNHWSRIAVWTLLGLLLIDPWAIISPGFWLSFTGVCVLLIMKKSHETYVKNFQQWPLPKLMDSSSPSFNRNITLRVRIARTARKLGYILFYVIRLQLILSLTLMPIIVIFFQEWPIAGLIANLLAVPWVSWLMVPLSILMVIIPHSLGFSILEKLQDIFFMGIDFLTTWLPALPVAKPSIGGIIFAILGLCWLLLPRGLPMRWLGLLLLLPLLYKSTATSIEYGQAHVSIMDVSNGLATVIRTQKHTLIYDTGPQRGSYSAANAVLRPFLYGEGVRRINRLIVSHADNDHAGGIETLHQSFPIDSMILGDAPTAWPTLPSALYPTNNPVVKYCPTQWYQWTWDGVDFAIIRAPIPPQSNHSQKRIKHYNNASCILKVTTRKGKATKSLLLTGDIEWEAQEYFVIKHRRVLKSDYVLAPHHGSATSAHQDFFQAVAPRYLLVSGGSRQRYYPAKAMMQALEKNTISPTLRHTWFDGAIQWTLSAGQSRSDIDDDDTQPTGFRKKKQRYWQQAIYIPYIHSKL